MDFEPYLRTRIWEMDEVINGWDALYLLLKCVVLDFFGLYWDLKKWFKTSPMVV